jgi:hypothetical protein
MLSHVRYVVLMSLRSTIGYFATTWDTNMTDLCVHTIIFILISHEMFLIFNSDFSIMNIIQLLLQ